MYIYIYIYIYIYCLYIYIYIYIHIYTNNIYIYILFVFNYDCIHKQYKHGGSREYMTDYLRTGNTWGVEPVLSAWTAVELSLTGPASHKG